jgi:hypothetical protein
LVNGWCLWACVVVCLLKYKMQFSRPPLPAILSTQYYIHTIVTSNHWQIFVTCEWWIMNISHTAKRSFTNDKYSLATIHKINQNKQKAAQLLRPPSYSASLCPTTSVLSYSAVHFLLLGLALPHHLRVVISAVHSLLPA